MHFGIKAIYVPKSMLMYFKPAIMLHIIRAYYLAIAIENNLATSLKYLPKFNLIKQPKITKQLLCYINYIKPKFLNKLALN